MLIKLTRLSHVSLRQKSKEKSAWFITKAEGKSIQNELIKEIEYKGYKTIVAGIDANNEGSIKLHEKFNFVACGNIKSVGYKFDKWLDLAFYQLILK